MELLKINRTKAVQENFLGNNAVFHGYAGMPDFKGRVYDERQCELEADRLKELGVRIVRTYTKWWAWERETGWNWDNEVMTAFYKWCKRMQVRDIDIAIHGGWCLGDVTGTAWGGDEPFSDGDVDFYTAAENFAAYVSEMLHQLIEVRGFTNIKYLMLFTESEHVNVHFENLNAFQMWEVISRTIHNRLVKDGRRDLVKLIGPNENARTHHYPKALEFAKNNADDFLDFYGCHIYERQCIDSRDNILSGNRAITFTMAGHRVQQYVSLKKGEKYTFKINLKVEDEDLKHLSGYLIFGFFEKPVPREGKVRAIFESGGQPTTRLEIGSTKLICPTECAGKWQEFEIEYTPLEDTDAVVGVFSDIKTATATAYLDDLSLTSESSAENMLKNPSFEDEDMSWQVMTCEPVAYDMYNDFVLFVKKMQNIIGDRELWYDEFSCLHKYGERFTSPKLVIGMVMGNLAFMNCGVSNSFIWTVFDQQWPNNTTTSNDSFFDGNHKMGFMPVLTESEVPYPGYYGFGLVSKYAGGGEGTKVFAESQGSPRLHCTLTEQPDGTVTLIVVNARDEAVNFSADIGGDSAKTFYRYMYDSSKVVPDESAVLPGVDKEITVLKNTLSDTLPPYSIAVYRG